MVDLDQLLIDLGQRGGSELHLSPGKRPLFRISGDLRPQETYPPVAAEDVQATLHRLMGTERAKFFAKDLSAQFAYEIPGYARFRVFVFISKGAIAATFGLIPLEVPTIDGMGLPGVLKEIANQRYGLVILAGATSSGKSTTLAAMLQHINQNETRHILSIEDPMEFVFTDELSVISQMEIGLDTQSVTHAQRVVTGGDVDVVAPCVPLTPELLEAALRWAESGRLVFLQSSAPNAREALEEALSLLKAGIPSVQARLGRSLLAVFAQRLAKRADGYGRCAAIEIAINSPAIRELIEAGNLKDLEKGMQEGAHYKMQTFNMALYRLFKAGAIRKDEALASSSAPEDLRMMLEYPNRADEDWDGGGSSPYPPGPKPRFPKGNDDDFGGGCGVPIKPKA